jgi:carbamoyl-phosphate synthase large subunit
MSDVTILITACGSKTVTHGLVSALDQTAKYRCTLIGTDVRAHTPLWNGHNYYQVPPSEDASFPTTIRSIATQRGVRAIIPLIEEDLIALKHPDSGCHSMTVGMPYDLLRSVSSKGQMLADLSARLAAPFGVPWFARVRTGEELLRAFHARPRECQRLVCKPSQSRGCRGAVLLASDPFTARQRSFLPTYRIEEFAPRLDSAAEDYVLMEYLAGDDFTISCFAEKGELHCIVPFVREEFSPGMTWAGHVRNDQRVIQYVVAVTLALCLDGYFNMQLRVRDGEPLIYEINPRLSGTSMLALAAGINFAEMMLDHHFGEYRGAGLRMAPPRFRFTRGLTEVYADE